MILSVLYTYLPPVTCILSPQDGSHLPETGMRKLQNTILIIGACEREMERAAHASLFFTPTGGVGKQPPFLKVAYNTPCAETAPALDVLLIDFDRTTMWCSTHVYTKMSDDIILQFNTDM